LELTSVTVLDFKDVLCIKRVSILAALAIDMAALSLYKEQKPMLDN
jgi:hypothetical protein